MQDLNICVVVSRATWLCNVLHSREQSQDPGSASRVPERGAQVANRKCMSLRRTSYILHTYAERSVGQSTDSFGGRRGQRMPAAAPLSCRPNRGLSFLPVMEGAFTPLHVQITRAIVNFPARRLISTFPAAYKVASFGCLSHLSPSMYDSI